MSRAARASIPGMRAVVLAALAVAVPAAAEPVTTASKTPGVTIDWTRGAVVARGVGPADRHAPSPTVARTGARRAAEEQARARLTEAVAALPVAGGGTVGKQARGPAADRLAREIGAAPVVAVDLGTDGSVRVEVALGVEAVRIALDGPRVVAGADEDAGSPVVPVVPVVIDARGLAVTPAVGLELAADGARWRGPVVFARAGKDERRKPTAKARAARSGALTIERLPATGALVVVLLPEKP